MNASCVPILEILGHVIVIWDTKKLKKRRFLARKFINSLTTQHLLTCKAEIWTQRVLINALCKPSMGAPGHVTKISQVENGQKVVEFQPIYLGKYRYWWKMVCDFWAHYQPHFFWVCSFTPTWKLFCFVLFLLLFFLFLFSFSSPVIYF